MDDKKVVIISVISERRCTSNMTFPEMEIFIEVFVVVFIKPFWAP